MQINARSITAVVLLLIDPVLKEKKNSGNHDIILQIPS